MFSESGHLKPFNTIYEIEKRATNSWKNTRSEEPQEMQATGSWSAVVKSAAVSALKGLCAGYCFIKYVASLGQAEGPSMYPTISGDTLLIDKWTSSKRYRVGDVVTAWSPETRNYMVCKRIKGMPGDIIKSVPPLEGGEPITVIVPEGHVWLEGDNPLYSKDSRYYGPLPMSLLYGRVIFKLSFHNWGRAGLTASRSELNE